MIARFFLCAALLTAGSAGAQQAEISVPNNKLMADSMVNDIKSGKLYLWGVLGLKGDDPTVCINGEGKEWYAREDGLCYATDEPDQSVWTRLMIWLRGLKP